MHAAVHDNRYFCWYDTGAERGGLIFDLTRGAMSLTRTDVYATAAYPMAAAMSCSWRWPTATSTSGGGAPLAMRRARASPSALLNARRTSAPAAGGLAAPIRFSSGCARRSRPTPGRATCRWWHTVRNGRPFRLPGNYRARAFEFTLEGTAAITEATVASTLGNVTAV